jgi:hypothetical protein
MFGTSAGVGWSGALVWLGVIAVGAFLVSWLLTEVLHLRRAPYVGFLATSTSRLTAGYQMGSRPRPPSRRETIRLNDPRARAEGGIGRTGDGEATGVGRSELRGESVRSEIVADGQPLPLGRAVRALSRCALRTAMLLAQSAISQPTDHVGEVLRFGDGSGGRVYRETIVKPAAVDAPVVLVVSFQLRWVRGWGHALFRAESLLNTPLFVGFPGFVSKLWLANDENGVYRGFYQWNHAHQADAYVRALWWVLSLVSVRGSIHYVVVPGLRRDDVLSDPTVLELATPDRRRSWWRLTAVEQPRTG